VFGIFGLEAFEIFGKYLENIRTFKRAGPGE
jgi:hypothetical protein